MDYYIEGQHRPTQAYYQELETRLEKGEGDTSFKIGWQSKAFGWYHGVYRSKTYETKEETQAEVDRLNKEWVRIEHWIQE